MNHLYCTIFYFSFIFQIIVGILNNLYVNSKTKLVVFNNYFFNNHSSKKLFLYTIAISLGIALFKGNFYQNYTYMNLFTTHQC